MQGDMAVKCGFIVGKHFLLFPAPCLTLATPSALRATVSPRRRCTTLEGAALRGKGLRLARLLLRALLAPLIGELAAKPTEGLPELRYCH